MQNEIAQKKIRPDALYPGDSFCSRNDNRHRIFLVISRQNLAGYFSFVLLDTTLSVFEWRCNTNAIDLYSFDKIN